jgi:hypothetical protein
MLSKYWQSRGVNVFLYYRYHSSIVPPVLYDETDRALRDVLLYGRDTGFVRAEDTTSYQTFRDLEFGIDGPDLLESFDFDSFLHGSYADQIADYSVLL